MDAFIVLVNEETQQYEPVPCTVTTCWGHYGRYKTYPERTVELKDGTVMEDVEAMRVFLELDWALYFVARLNDYKGRDVAPNDWALLESGMVKKCMQGAG